VPHSTQLEKERIATLTPENQAGVRVVRRHHLLVRCSHWLNLPILLALILSGVSIYWASPIYKHKPDPVTGNVDPLADIGICLLVPGTLGLKNVKAITRITYAAEEPKDYWAERRYSYYDGI
jgi:hypothetical protein